MMMSGHQKKIEILLLVVCTKQLCVAPQCAFKMEKLCNNNMAKIKVFGKKISSLAL